MRKTGFCAAWVAVGACAAFVVVGCSSKSEGTTGGSTSGSAKPSATTASASASAPVASASAKVAAKPRVKAKSDPKDKQGAFMSALKNKKPSKPATAKKTDMKKGDPSNKDKPIPKDNKKIDEQASKAGEKKKVDAPPAGACTGVGDGVGTCAGNLLLFCAGGELWQVDCDEHGRMTGFTGGTCYETAKEIDCYGITLTDNPSVSVYCDPYSNICCDSDGYCWGDAVPEPPMDPDPGPDTTPDPTPDPIPDDPTPEPPPDPHPEPEPEPQPEPEPPPMPDNAE